MSSIYLPPKQTELPDHTQLPETDGSLVENFDEFPLGMLLTDSLRPLMELMHPNNDFALGHDSGIYYRHVPEQPLQGCKSPDWYYVPNVKPLPPDERRRSYVMWQEHIPPELVLEFVSGNGSDERDATPETGKFWVYERAIHAAYYGIFESISASLEMYKLVEGRYQRMEPNLHGRYFIPALSVEIGVWRGHYMGKTANWLRWWDTSGNLLDDGWEGKEQERLAKEQAEGRARRAERQARQAEQNTKQAERKAKQADQRAKQAEHQQKEAERQADAERLAKEQAKLQVEQLAAKLRALGIDPDA